MDEFWEFVIRFFRHRTTRYAMSWLLCLLALWLSWFYAKDAFRDQRRGDGNSGHTTIDFGGQWLMGAMLTEGHGRELFNRVYQRELLVAAYPHEDEVPEDKRQDDEKGKRDPHELMSWFMGPDNREQADTIAGFVTPLGATHGLDAALLVAGCDEEWTEKKLENATKRRIGGPLYPPVNSLYMAPLALLRPQTAYQVNQALCLVWAVVTGLAVSYFSRGRFWWPLAATLVLVYPGFKGAHHLGQNAPLTLCILMWGWALLARGHPVAGGTVWGLLAFKPVWAMAFFLVPLVTARFRFCFAMLLTGTLLGLATLPFVGLHSWIDWLSVGREAAALYNVDQNWVFLSRDLLGIPRRWMLDFSLPNASRDKLSAAIVGWTLWGLVMEITLLLVALRWRQARQTEGPAIACLLLAAWMSCFHFMYYDVLLTALPMFCLLTGPRRFLDPIFFAFVRVPPDHLGTELATYYGPHLPREYPSEVPLLQPGHGSIMVLNRMVPTVLMMLLIVEHFFQAIDIGVTMTAWWMPKPRDVTIRYEIARFGPAPDDVEAVSTTGKWTEIQTIPGRWPERPFKISSKVYQDGQPWDTYVLMFLWLWCGWLWVRAGPRPLATDVPRPEEADVILVPVDGPDHAIRPA